MAKIDEVGPCLGVRATCDALGVSPATYYRSRRPKTPPSRPEYAGPPGFRSRVRLFPDEVHSCEDG